MSNIMSHDFLVRELEKIDLDNGFFDTLSNLNVSDIDNPKALHLFNKIKSNPQHKIFVAALNDGSVIGSITVLIEDKFIHSGGKVAHIEDVVTRKGYEGSGIGSALVCKALEFSRASGCYKVILDCLENIVRFYEKCGFRKYGTSMRCEL